jgi:hypothetical protein
MGGFLQEQMDPKTLYDERISKLVEVKNEMSSKGVGGDRLLWDMNNFVKKLAEQRKYQTGD